MSTPEITLEEKTMAAKGQTPWRRFAADFFESRLAVAGLGVFVLIALSAIFAPWITPQDPYDLMQIDILDGRLPPGSTSGEMTYLLGTDDQGRAMRAGVFYGLRSSLCGGAAATLGGVLRGGGVGCCFRLLGRAHRVAGRVFSCRCGSTAPVCAGGGGAGRNILSARPGGPFRN